MDRIVDVYKPNVLHENSYLMVYVFESNEYIDRKFINIIKWFIKDMLKYMVYINKQDIR